MLVMADTDISETAFDLLMKHRLSLESYIRDNEEFARAMTPVEVGCAIPPVVKKMARAAVMTGVGPMAAVAGAIAECIGEELMKHSNTVIIENGGDVFISSPEERIVGIYAGKGEAEFDLGLKIDSASSPLGVCTSSGIVGPSYSSGKARAATVIASSASLADAAATALGNRLITSGDITPSLEWAGSIEGIIGAVAILDKSLGAWGKVDLVHIEKGEIIK